MKIEYKTLSGLGKNLFLTVIGTLLLSFATGVFILPYNLVVGGISGFAIVLNAPVPIGEDVWIAVITLLLFVLGAFCLGRDFALKTLVSTIVYPLGVSLFSHVASSEFLDGFFDIAGSSYGEIGVLLAAIFGGVLTGAGCALAFLGGGSTGGVDIIAFIICKIFKKAKSSVVIFALDASVIVAGIFVNRDFVLMLLGIVCAFLTALMIDKVFLGRSRAFIAHIISEKSEEINRGVIDKIDRTSTIIKGNGGYTGKEYDILMVSFTVNQYADLLRLVTDIDKKAFITVHPAHEINGEGFSHSLPDDK